MKIDNSVAGYNGELPEYITLMTVPKCPKCKQELSPGENEGVTSDWFCLDCEKEYDNWEVS